MRAWCNGSLIDPESPAIAVLDHGFTVGDGVFEAIKVVDNVPFALTRHLDRLAFSAKGLGLPAPDDAQYARRSPRCSTARDLTLGRIRITYTAGISPLGSGRGSRARPSLWSRTEAKPYRPPPRPWWSRGRATSMVPPPGSRRRRTPKTSSPLAYAAEHDAAEAIFANTAGNLCEGTGTNVFCVFGDEVATPPLSAGCLAGVTRDLVVEWCDVD